MTSQSNSVLTSSLKSFSHASSLIVIIVGCLVLVGWVFDIAVLKSVLPGLATMKANTALAFALAGVSLRLLAMERPGRRTRRIADICAAATALIGLLTLTEYLFPWDLKIDQLFFSDRGPSPPGRMAPATASNFFLIGTALLLLDARNRAGIFQLPASVAGLVAFLALLGYLYDLKALYAIAPYTGMALHTAALFFVLSLGLLFARPDLGLMRVVSADNLGAVLARRLLPASIVIPPALGWLRLQGERAGFYGLEFGLALFALSNVLVFAVLVWWSAKKIGSVDAARIEAQIGLQTSEEKFRSLLESAPDPIVISDKEGCIVLLNAQTEKVFGYSRDELFGKPVEILIPEKLRGAHVGHREKYYGDLRTRPMGMGSWYDLYARSKDGTTVPVDISLSPVRTDGQLLVMTIIRDITERKRAEEEIQHNLQRIRALHEIDTAISSTLDLRKVLNVLLEKIGLFLPIAAASTVRLLNRDTGELESLACRGLNEEEWKSQERRVLAGWPKKIVETKTPLAVRNLGTYQSTYNKEFLFKHGLISYLGVPLAAKDEVLGVLSVYTIEEHDFSNEETEFLTTLAGQAAIAIHNSQLYEETASLAGDLVKSNKVKDEFLSVMSHELRTPLNVVMGYTGMMKDGLLGEINPQQEEALGKVINRANDQLTIINNILHATVLETEKIKIESHELSLGDFITQLKSAYAAPINKELVFNWDYPADLPLIKTDSAKLKQILQNLIDNALKFTDKGSITISAKIRQQAEGNRQQEEDPLTPRSTEAHDRSHASRLTPSFVEFKVADTGVGIPKEALPFVFEKFRQADSSETRLFGGVGMGLYIVKKFSELLGGTVEVESEAGKGSTFRVIIPLGS